MMFDDQPAWMSEAPCNQTDPDAFYPEKGENAATAKKVCAGCEFASLCLKYAIDNDERFGVWGGTTPNERWALKRGVEKGTKPIPHGTARGYWTHQDRRDPACQPCRAAIAEYERKRKAAAS